MLTGHYRYTQRRSSAAIGKGFDVSDLPSIMKIASGSQESAQAKLVNRSEDDKVGAGDCPKEELAFFRSIP